MAPISRPWRRFCAGDGWAPLGAALAGSGLDRQVGPVREVTLRAEKHGALYHPASLSVVGQEGTARFCVNVAATDLARTCLDGEAALLAGLRQAYGGEFLPAPYASGEEGGFGLLLEEWFSGFHEFHQDGAGRVRLWDYDAGERLLTAGQAACLYRQAARILTRYFDARTGAAIAPWHHAAGDFVGKVADGTVAVRCITVRGYGASRDFSEAGPLAGRLAALSFFTNLTLRMRLDRVDGVGELVLAGKDAAWAAVEGFALGLGERPDTRESAGAVLDFLASFSAEELVAAGRQLADPCPPDEAALLDAAWPAHGAVVVAALAAVTAG